MQYVKDEFNQSHYVPQQHRPGNGAEMDCDHCKYYSWYFDRCGKWDCKVDNREIHNCYEGRELHVIRDIMVGTSKMDNKPSESADCQ